MTRGVAIYCEDEGNFASLIVARLFFTLSINLFFQILYIEQPLKDLTRALGTYGLKDGDVVVPRQADRRPPPAFSGPLLIRNCSSGRDRKSVV